MNYQITPWFEVVEKQVVPVVIILCIAIGLTRILKALTNRLVQVSKTRARGAQMREQQTRTMAGLLYSVGTALIAIVAILMALSAFDIHVTSLLTAAGIVSVVIGFGLQSIIKDVLNGFFIVFEDQYVIGDTIQLNNETGRVESITLRRTVIRNAVGAMVTIPNSLVGQVANLSRDWSQILVDVTVPSDEVVGRALAALEKISGDFRADAGWSQAIVDGPRVLGVEALSLDGTILRLQVRTAPNRKDDVARELRRRIKLGFEESHIPLSHTHKIDFHGEMPPQPAHNN